MYLDYIKFFLIVKQFYFYLYLLVILEFVFIFILDYLYFGDESYSNEVVDGIIGGSGGGRIVIRSRYVDIDGEILVDGNFLDSRIGQGVGVYIGREGGMLDDNRYSLRVDI